MMYATSAGKPIKPELVGSYIKSLVNRFFKILPIYETEPDSLQAYIESLQLELIGCQELIIILHNDPAFISLLSILQYFRNNPNCSKTKLRREVFRAISICKSFDSKYVAKEECQ